MQVKLLNIVKLKKRMTTMTIIELNPKETECALCGCVCRIEHGLPMYEGEVVPDDCDGQWAGFTVCADCFAKHRPIPIPRAVENVNDEMR